jgi:hypothetical protein
MYFRYQKIYRLTITNNQNQKEPNSYATPKGIAPHASPQGRKTREKFEVKQLKN